MVHKRNDGSWVISGAIPEELAQEAKEQIESDPELTDGRMVREALRDYLN